MNPLNTGVIIEYTVMTLSYIQRKGFDSCLCRLAIESIESATVLSSMLRVTELHSANPQAK